MRLQQWRGHRLPRCLGTRKYTGLCSSHMSQTNSYSFFSLFSFSFSFAGYLAPNQPKILQGSATIKLKKRVNISQKRSSDTAQITPPKGRCNPAKATAPNLSRARRKSVPVLKVSTQGSLSAARKRHKISNSQKKKVSHPTSKIFGGTFSLFFPSSLFLSLCEGVLICSLSLFYFLYTLGIV